MEKPRSYVIEDVEIKLAPDYYPTEVEKPLEEPVAAELNLEPCEPKAKPKKQKKKKSRKGLRAFVISFICIILIAAIVLFLVIPLTGVFTKGKKGIIYVTALLAGGFYDEETGDAVWDPLSDETKASLFDFMTAYGGLEPKDEALGEILGQAGALIRQLSAEDGFIKKLTLNEDGTENFKLRPANMSDGRLKYGVLNSYRESYEAIESRYGSEYDVSIFNYDWRKDNRESALALEKYINDKGYTDVVLISHSMGGNVVAGYLANSEANRKKVNLYCSYGSPFLGSMEILSILEDPSSALTSMGDMSALTGKLGNFTSLVDLNFVTDMIGDLIMNLTSFYQLLPTIELIKSSQYKPDQSCIYLDGKPIRTQEELMAFYKTRPWAKKSDGTLKKAVLELQDYFDSVYVTLPSGERVHSTTLVNTHYFLGMNIPGNEAVRYVKGADDEYAVETIDRTVMGDCQVLAYSGTAGKELYENDIHIYHVAHHALGILFKEYPQEVTFGLIDDNLTVWEKIRMRS